MHLWLKVKKRQQKWIEWERWRKEEYPHGGWSFEKYKTTENFEDRVEGREQRERETRRHLVLSVGPWGGQRAELRGKEKSKCTRQANIETENVLRRN